MGISPLYVILLMVIGVVIFGKDLPDVMRKLGTALMEFRKGMSEFNSGAVSKGGNSKSGGTGGNSAAVNKFETPFTEIFESEERTAFSENKFEPPVS
ncbi:MAG: twin-arginine translocase TatA/TatE family subunit [Planctomycetaceae bacterium]|jgi:TatA/E family protein of Tat protein translocase|nr:twin-arginine translocase TatA/TatE family subunit [Planctomycetaceae bacterium]